MRKRTLTRQRESGFTLVELMVVMLIIAILAAVAIPSFVQSIRNAREAALKEDLHVMRDAIDSYTMDKNQAPQSLDDLVQSGYLKQIPVDPMTHSADTWQTSSDDTYSDVDETQPGINDVHSGSDEQGSDGQPYSSW
ncbi:MAG TPA: prepilin-type N-terminal cleavage/methylation domain-containing protein [Acidobacteriaceae bacterium]|nr:prepilin-type N-terminal cleavage/methylation domain-containing protein [Acidobacteriaceae bacterium]